MFHYNFGKCESMLAVLSPEGSKEAFCRPIGLYQQISSSPSGVTHRNCCNDFTKEFRHNTMGYDQWSNYEGARGGLAP